MLEQFTRQLAAAEPLADEQVVQAVERLVDEAEPATVKADFLSQLALKGESISEIAAFARALRAKSIPVPLDSTPREGEILDVVGTGGDRLGTINISTTAAILCAAAGATVAKHGNRASTSQAGSADVLEALGVRIDLTPERAARSLRELGFAFFFAPKYHPAFKHVAAARKLCAGRGQSTIFNYLGPLLNPARPTSMLVGVPRADLCEPLARVLQTLGVRRAMVVCGKVEPGLNPTGGAASLDELSTLGGNTIAEFYQERGFATSTLGPSQFPLQPATLKELAGGSAVENAEIARRILCGDECGPKRDAILLNAGAALFVAGLARSITEGWELAAETVDDGRAQAKLAALTARQPVDPG